MFVDQTHLTSLTNDTYCLQIDYGLCKDRFNNISYCGNCSYGFVILYTTQGSYERYHKDNCRKDIYDFLD